MFSVYIYQKRATYRCCMVVVRPCCEMWGNAKQRSQPPLLVGQTH